MRQLSIVMPSNRGLETSREAIESALFYAEKTDSRLIISDNSGDPRKKAEFAAASTHLTYLDSKGLAPADNLLRALEAADTPFIMPMGDDDAIFGLDDQPRLDFATLPEDVIGVRPTTLAWTVQEGVLDRDAFEILGQQASERLAEYHQKAKGHNALYYSAFRGRPYRALLETFYRRHPTRAGFCDWALVLTLIACGRIIHDPSTVFRYNMGNWRTREDVDATNAMLYRQAELPVHAERHASLLRFADVHCLLALDALPITAEERADAQARHTQIALGGFARDVMRGPMAFSKSARALVAPVCPVTNAAEGFALSLLILDELKPGLGEAYRAFHQSLLDESRARAIRPEDRTGEPRMQA